MSRIEESIMIMKKLRDQLHIPADDAGLKELGRRLSAYVKHGSVWAGYIEIPSIKRHLHVILPSNPAMEIRVVLKGLSH